jgi:YVTN family beta-propeller protein
MLKVCLNERVRRCCLRLAWSLGQILTLGAAALPPAVAPSAIETAPGMPPVVDPHNLYSETGANDFSPAVAGALPLIYVPNLRSDDVYVIDQKTLKVVERFRVGVMPQHVVPSWDLQTLWVTNNGLYGRQGSLTPIDPKTGKPGPPVPVPDPYNMYFTPDGKSAIIVAERLKMLEFRDPHTMALQAIVRTPRCPGIDHGDFSIDGRYAIFTCEFGGDLVKVDVIRHKVVGYLSLTHSSILQDVGIVVCAYDGDRVRVEGAHHAVLGYLRLAQASMPQDIRVSPDGKIFYVADMARDGVFLVDGDTFKKIGFIPTGVGTHGLYPSRDATELYVSNRGTHMNAGRPHGPGSIAVIDFKTRRVVKVWPILGGGSPDMGDVSASGKHLWLTGRWDNVVYRIDTGTGAVDQIPVGREPHGLSVWPQPGRYSTGHTGNMR